MTSSVTVIRKLLAALRGCRDALDAIPEGKRGNHDALINRQLRRADASIELADQFNIEEKTMSRMTAIVGEQLTWLRQGEALKVTVLETRNDGHRVNLRVNGWLSNTWEDLNEGVFQRGHDWKAKNGGLVSTREAAQ